jgi:class 3 adenylate cyclase
VIQRFDGWVAQYLGDGLLVYFGYPQAHEDDAQRAIRAGREIIESVGTVNRRLEHEKNVRLAVRVGITLVWCWSVDGIGRLVSGGC